MDGSITSGALGSSGLTVDENSILIGGLATQSFASDQDTWGDSIYFQSDATEILAGTAVSGTLTVSGTNLFDPLASNFQLVSGFDSTNLDWVRLEANATSAVPISASVWLFCSGLLGLIGIARRKMAA